MSFWTVLGTIGETAFKVASVWFMFQAASFMRRTIARQSAAEQRVAELERRAGLPPGPMMWWELAKKPGGRA